MDIVRVLLYVVMITLVNGCRQAPPATPEKPLREVLRDAVRAEAASQEHDSDRAVVIQVMARFLDADSAQNDASGDLIEHTRTNTEVGGYRCVASWRRVINFRLGPREGPVQHVVVVDKQSNVSTTVDLADVPPELADVPSRLRNARDLALAENDPLLQVLTISGFADTVLISQNDDGNFSAIVETPKVELEVRASTLVGARVAK